SQQHIVAASVLLLNRAVKDDGIQIFKPETIGSRRIVRAEDHRLENSDVEFVADVHAQMMERNKFVGIPAKHGIGNTAGVGCHLIQQKQIVELPHLHIPLQKQRRWGEVGKDQRPVSVADKKPIMSELNINTLCRFK